MKTATRVGLSRRRFSTSVWCAGPNWTVCRTSTHTGSLARWLLERMKKTLQQTLSWIPGQNPPVLSPPQTSLPSWRTGTPTRPSMATTGRTGAGLSPHLFPSHKSSSTQNPLSRSSTYPSTPSPGLPPPPPPANHPNPPYSAPPAYSALSAP